MTSSRKTLRYNYHDSSMKPRRIDCGLAILVLLCVLALFLFPAMQGPYSAVHGPVTALQSARSAARLRVSIVRSALHVLRDSSISLLVVWSWRTLSHSEIRPFASRDSSSVLRC